MNPLLSRLQPYPFERLKQLFSTVTPNPAFTPISLGIGEPRHATPQLVHPMRLAAKRRRNLAGLSCHGGVACVTQRLA